MAELPLTGGCACGAIRWELDEAPLLASYCHCTRCQRRTGTAASMNAVVRTSALRLVRGEELLRSWQPERGAAKVFCSACGSGMWAARDDAPDFRALRIGTFDQDPKLRPGYRQFVDYAAPWEPIPDDGLERFPERRPA